MDEKERIAREIMEEACETDEIFEDCDMDLFDNGYLDSFAVLTIILGIETGLGVKLQVTDVEKEQVCTVNAFIDFVKGLA